MIASGTDDLEWAIIADDYVYPTCVQAGVKAKTTTTLVPNTDDGTMSPNKQSNILQFSNVFTRNNYIASTCPWIQPICDVEQVNSWWLGQVRLNVEAFKVTWNENWEANLCIGEDDVVRYVTATGFVNTCTGYKYV